MVGYRLAAAPSSRFPLRRLPRLEEALQRLRVLLEKSREVGQRFDRGRAEMMFDAFDVPLLGFRVQSEQRKKTGQGFMALLNAGGYRLAFVRQHQAAVFLAVQVTLFSELLHHAGDRCLLDVQRTGDVHHAGIALFLD